METYVQIGWGVLYALVGFAIKVLVGLITKNEIKSDEADRRIEQEIKALHKEMKETESRYRNNDRDLYGQVGAVKSELAHIRAVLECIKSSR